MVENGASIALIFGLISYIASSGCNTGHTDLASRGRKTIVVVCNGGRHRSAAVACALLVLSDGLSVEAAEEYIFQRAVGDKMVR